MVIAVGGMSRDLLYGAGLEVVYLISKSNQALSFRRLTLIGATLCGCRVEDVVEGV